jgi:hypothetical protein
VICSSVPDPDPDENVSQKEKKRNFMFEELDASPKA